MLTIPAYYTLLRLLIVDIGSQGLLKKREFNLRITNSAFHNKA